MSFALYDRGWVTLVVGVVGTVVVLVLYRRECWRDETDTGSPQS